MENTTTNRQLLNRLQALCEGTPYELRIRDGEQHRSELLHPRGRS